MRIVTGRVWALADGKPPESGGRWGRRAKSYQDSAILIAEGMAETAMRLGQIRGQTATSQDFADRFLSSPSQREKQSRLTPNPDPGRQIRKVAVWRTGCRQCRRGSAQGSPATAMQKFGRRRHPVFPLRPFRSPGITVFAPAGCWSCLGFPGKDAHRAAPKRQSPGGQARGHLPNNKVASGNWQVALNKNWTGVDAPSDVT